MKPDEKEKKEIAGHLLEEMDAANLHNRDVARLLNLKLCYITWIKNEKYWPDVSEAAWNRFREWHESRVTLAEYKFPEGEELVVLDAPVKIPVAAGPDEHAPENILELEPGAAQPKQKRKYTRHDKGEDKSVKIILQKEAMEQLKKRVDLLIEDNNRLTHLVKELQNNHLLIQGDQDIKIDQFYKVLAERIDLVEKAIPDIHHDIEELQEGIAHLVTLPKPDGKAQIVFFQRNSYK